MATNDEEGIEALFGIIAFVVVGHIVVFIVQWIWVCIIWIWEAVLLPFFIFFTPALLILIVTISIFCGTGIAAQNYFRSLIANVYSDGFSGKLTRNYIISMLTTFLVLLYISFAVSSAILIYPFGLNFLSAVISHYESLVFPSFQIHFLFWA